MNNKQVIKIKNSDMHNLHIRKLNNAGENFLTESGVYKLVFKSHKPNAEAFTAEFFRHDMVMACKIAPHKMICCCRIDSPFLDSEVHKNFIYLPLEKSAQKYYSKNIDTCSDDGFDNTDIR